MVSGNFKKPMSYLLDSLSSSLKSIMCEDCYHVISDCGYKEFESSSPMKRLTKRGSPCCLKYASSASIMPSNHGSNFLKKSTTVVVYSRLRN
jgi:hypothetical protein